jgi:hypothetical protein
MGGGLQQVDVPKQDEDGNVVQDQEGNEVREVLLEVEDIHKAVLERNNCHFHQADKTPFAGGAKNTILYDLIGYTGMSQAAKHVVEGTFLEKHGDKLKNLLPETEQLIKEMAMPEEIKVLGEKINCEISEDNFISGFRKSGWHLGHYKAIVYNPDLKKQEPEKQHLHERKMNFVEALVKLINVPLCYGFAPKQCIREGKSPDDKKTLHFLLNFLQISTMFASFSRAHAGTLQNPSICPCATTL